MVLGWPAYQMDDGMDGGMCVYAFCVRAPKAEHFVPYTRRLCECSRKGCINSQTSYGMQVKAVMGGPDTYSRICDVLIDLIAKHEEPWVQLILRRRLLLLKPALQQDEGHNLRGSRNRVQQALPCNCRAVCSFTSGQASEKNTVVSLLDRVLRRSRNRCSKPSHPTATQTALLPQGMPAQMHLSMLCCHRLSAPCALTDTVLESSITIQNLHNYEAPTAIQSPSTVTI
eukprot:scaffold60764_cov19-Tisochrysis_lutea.AAC.2